MTNDLPDFDAWFRNPYWTLQESLALSMGRDLQWAMQISRHFHPKMQPPTLSESEYLSRLNFATRAVEMGAIQDVRGMRLGRAESTRVLPIEFLAWVVDSTDWKLPRGLLELISLKDSQTVEKTAPLVVPENGVKNPGHVSTGTDKTQIWILEESAGKKWRCGHENNPVLISGTQGLTDLRYAVLRKGEDCDPLEYLAASDDDVRVAKKLRYTSPDEAIDSTAKRQLEEEIENLKLEFKSANERGDIEEAEQTQVRLVQIEEYLRKNTKPGGRSRPITEGVPHVKGINAMRNRKRTVVKNLNEAGLREMADHIRKQFVLRSRSFSYLGSQLKIIRRP